MATKKFDKTIYVLDSSLSAQLTVQVGSSNVEGDPLWCARFNYTMPEAVTNMHLEFLRAGADIISTNTYQASIGGFMKYLNLSYTEAYSVIVRAVELAKQARNIFLKENDKTITFIPLIAGSVGPYGAHLHDGSEYDGNYADVTSPETIKNWHRPRIQALLEGGVDLLAIETIPCQKEAEILVELLKEFPSANAWLSFSIKDEKSLAHGEDFKVVAKKCWDANREQLIAVGANCCSPYNVSSLLKGINEDRSADPIPLVVYPNSGEKYVPGIGWTEKDKCKPLDSFVQEWLDLGVKFVGGCCRTSAHDITLIKKQVQKWMDKKGFKIDGNV